MVVCFGYIGHEYKFFVIFRYVAFHDALEHMRICFPDNKNLDYVAAWYKITSKFIENTSIEAAFVSTNSITQGEQVSALWKQLINQENIQITFAYRTFKWENDARGQAAVHCVIIGISKNTIKKKKKIFDGNTQKEVENINPYLVDAPNDFLLKRSCPLCEVTPMIYGNEPREGGFLILSDVEKAELIGKYSWLDKRLTDFVAAVMKPRLKISARNRILRCFFFSWGGLFGF